jgi:hypothetical protein
MAAVADYEFLDDVDGGAGVDADAAGGYFVGFAGVIFGRARGSSPSSMTMASSIAPSLHGYFGVLDKMAVVAVDGDEKFGADAG